MRHEESKQKGDWHEDISDLRSMVFGQPDDRDDRQKADGQLCSYEESVLPGVTCFHVMESVEPG